MASGYPDFEGNKSKLFTAADWAAIGATDKNFTAGASDKSRGQTVEVSYTVPAGLTLYVAGMAFQISGTLDADSDNNQFGDLVLADFGATIYARLGGNGGGGIPFPKPIAIEALGKAIFTLYNRSNHRCALRLVAWGYEL